MKTVLECPFCGKKYKSDGWFLRHVGKRPEYYYASRFYIMVIKMMDKRHRGELVKC